MKVFIDACCFFAAFRSPSGGSALILQFAREGKFQIFTNETVVDEACRNLHKKESPEKASHFLQFLREVPVKILPPPTREDEQPWEKETHQKDAHVLASAIKAQVDYVVTLDKQHLLIPKLQKVFPISIKNPKDFLAELLSSE
ncbi:MAG: PIN domain-containing protein [Ignavibacteria bacterium]|nr:PIN domain-containing protein [Ignavibacteria bacterium]